jgi:DNA replication and repair protein RecF
LILTGLELKNFRNYEHLDLELSPRENLIVGGNAQGKSNLLEGVYFLAHLRSNRSPRVRELVLEGSQRASVRGIIIDGESRVNIGVSFGKTGRNVQVNGQRVESATRIRGLVKCVMFSPEDLYIVKGDPTRRREFLDETMEGMGAAAAHTILHYKHLLRQRNAVLRSLEKRGGARRRYLEPWDETLAKAGSEIVAERARIVNELANEMGMAYQQVTGEKLEVGIRYKCTFEAEGSVSSLEERMRKGLEATASVEERARTTVIGPHRDEVEIKLKGRDARFAASQGEQRTIAFCMRMVQRGYLEKETGKAPILLLDDVLSELDAVRRRGVLMAAAPGSQTLVTATELPEGKLSGEAKIFRVKSGRAELE